MDRSRAGRMSNIDKKDQQLAKAAIAKATAWQQARGVAPNIQVIRHHDHLGTFFSSKEASFTRWPICLKCSKPFRQKIVEGYGIAEETNAYVELEATCHGERQSYRIYKPYPTVLVDEPHWMSEVAQMVTFFGTHL